MHWTLIKFGRARTSLLRLHNGKRQPRALHRKTSQLRSRVWEHKHHIREGFSDDYNVVRLVYYQEFDEVIKAINREKQIKRWRRAKKIALIESVNPDGRELSDRWYDHLKLYGTPLAR